jgi:hypothetical protein
MPEISAVNCSTVDCSDCVAASRDFTSRGVCTGTRRRLHLHLSHLGHALAPSAPTRSGLAATTLSASPAGFATPAVPSARTPRSRAIHLLVGRGREQAGQGIQPSHRDGRIRRHLTARYRRDVPSSCCFKTGRDGDRSRIPVYTVAVLTPPRYGTRQSWTWNCRRHLLIGRAK